jgi:hypothetical protein
MDASLATRIKACFNAMETSQFTFNKKFKVMLTMFWDSQRVLLTHFQKHGENVNSSSYCEILLKLQDAIRMKHPGQLARGVLLHRDCQTQLQPKHPRREFKNYSRNFLNIHLKPRLGP